MTALVDIDRGAMRIMVLAGAQEWCRVRLKCTWAKHSCVMRLYAYTIPTHMITRQQLL